MRTCKIILLPQIYYRDSRSMRISNISTELRILAWLAVVEGYSFGHCQFPVRVISSLIDVLQVEVGDGIEVVFAQLLEVGVHVLIWEIAA